MAWHGVYAALRCVVLCCAQGLLDADAGLARGLARVAVRLTLEEGFFLARVLRCLDVS